MRDAVTEIWMKCYGNKDEEIPKSPRECGEMKVRKGSAEQVPCKLGQERCLGVDQRQRDSTGEGG